MAEIIQLAKDTLKGGTKTEIYPKTSAAAIQTTNKAGNATTLEELLIKEIIIDDTSYTPENNSIDLGTLTAEADPPEAIYGKCTLPSTGFVESDEIVTLNLTIEQAKSMLNACKYAEVLSPEPHYPSYIGFYRGKYLITQFPLIGIEKNKLIAQEQNVIIHVSDDDPVAGKVNLAYFNGVFDGLYIAGTIFIELPETGDLDGNGKVDASDVNVLLNLLTVKDESNLNEVSDDLLTAVHVEYKVVPITIPKTLICSITTPIESGVTLLPEGYSSKFKEAMTGGSQIPVIHYSYLLPGNTSIRNNNIYTAVSCSITYPYEMSSNPAIVTFYNPIADPKYLIVDLKTGVITTGNTSAAS